MANGDDCANMGIPGVRLFGETWNLFGVLGGPCKENGEDGFSCCCSFEESEAADRLMDRLKVLWPPNRSSPFALLFFFFFTSRSFSSLSESFFGGAAGGGTSFAQSGTTYGPLRIGAEARLVERKRGRGCDGAGGAAGALAGCPPLKVPSARMRSPPQPVLIGTPFSSSIRGGRLDEDFDLFSELTSPLSPPRTSLSFLFLC